MILKGKTMDRLKGLSPISIPVFGKCNYVYICFVKLLV